MHRSHRLPKDHTSERTGSLSHIPTSIRKKHFSPYLQNSVGKLPLAHTFKNLIDRLTIYMIVAVLNNSPFLLVHSPQSTCSWQAQSTLLVSLCISSTFWLLSSVGQESFALTLTHGFPQIFSCPTLDIIDASHRCTIIWLRTN